MSLYPGGRKLVDGIVEPGVDDAAMNNSMAALIEEEFESLFQTVNGMTVPDQGEKDRRILFIAVARGVLRYLRDNHTNNISANLGQNPAPVSLKVDMNQP